MTNIRGEEWIWTRNPLLWANVTLQPFSWSQRTSCCYLVVGAFTHTPRWIFRCRIGGQDAGGPVRANKLIISARFVAFQQRDVGLCIRQHDWSLQAPMLMVIVLSCGSLIKCDSNFICTELFAEPVCQPKLFYLRLVPLSVCSWIAEFRECNLHAVN